MKKNITILLLTIFSLPCYAQQYNARFEDLTSNLGVQNIYVSKFQQDKQGYLWIGTTANGLMKYDGYSATKYLYNPFNPNSLAQNQIYTFFIDKNDMFWVGTPEGLCKFDPHSEIFTRYDSTLVPRMPDLGNVSAIIQDDQGQLWIGNFEGKLWRFDMKKNEFISYTSKLLYNENKSPLEGFHESITGIYKDKNGWIWIANSSGLHSIEIQAGQKRGDDKISFAHFKNDPVNINSLSNAEFSNIYADKNGVVWIANGQGLINSYDPVTKKFTHFLPDSSTLKGISGWDSWMAEDTSGNLWITAYNGLYKLNRERTKFTPYSQNDHTAYGLKSGTVSAVVVDAGNNLFVSTANGIQSLNLNQKAFGLLQADTDKKNSLSNNKITSVLEDKSGYIWIGTFGGGVNKWDKKNGTIIQYQYKPGKSNGLASNYVHAILEDVDGSLWIGNSEFLSHLNTRTGIFENFNSNSRNLTNADAKNINALCKDAEGLIWMGTGNGIKSFDPTTRKFTHYFYEPGNPNGISDYTAIDILADSRGDIWVGTNSIAFNKFDKKTGLFTHFKNNALDTNSISSNIVNCLFEDSKGNMWIGTSGGGVCRYNYKTNTFHTPGRNRQLPWNSVFSIREDNNGNIWLGTNMGLSCYLPSLDEFVTYVEQDGLQSSYFATSAMRDKGSSFRGKDGILYFGGYNGLNYFDPAGIHPNDYIPPIVITQFKIFDKLQPGKNQDSVIILNYNQNFFSFEFAALNYTNSSKNKYAYQLKGFDPDWIFSGSRRYAGYTNLGPGEYVFRVRGSNNDGIWNENGISVKLIILPPWWRTWWAYAIYGLILITGIWAVDRYQKRRVILAEQEKAQKKELAQAKEIEKAYRDLKTTQSQLIHSEKMASLGELTAGIAHEIQNPLNFINNFSDVNEELLTEMKDELSKGKIEDALALANDAIENQKKINHHGRRADVIVKGMLQHSRSSSGQKEPTDINALADEYLRLSYHGLRAKDQLFNATLKTDFDASIGAVNIVSQDIGRVILNLINNAFYAVDEKKKSGTVNYEPTVSVTTHRDGDNVEVRVKDNGNGIPRKVLDKIFQPFFTTKPTGQGTGLGLSLSYDIVKAHGGELHVETKEGEGSVFSVTLPL